MADNVVQDLDLLVYLTYSFHFTMQLLYIRLRLLLDTYTFLIFNFETSFSSFKKFII